MAHTLEKMTSAIKDYESSEKSKNAALTAALPENADVPTPDPQAEKAMEILGREMAKGKPVQESIKEMEEMNDEQNIKDTR